MYTLSPLCSAVVAIESTHDDERAGSQADVSPKGTIWYWYFVPAGADCEGSGNLPTYSFAPLSVVGVGLANVPVLNAFAFDQKSVST